MDVNRCVDDLDSAFEYTNTNVSHKWLFSYPGKLMPEKNELAVSLSQETYREPARKIVSTQGKRKKILENFYRHIIAEELKAEFDSDDIIVEPYETDYTEHFKHPNDLLLPGECLTFNQKMKKNNKSFPHTLSQSDKIEELKMKYPLYTSRPYTFAVQRVGKDQFGRKSTISKSPDQNYDNIEY